jgi:hypothetical protein
MKVNTKNRKNARTGFEQIFGRQRLVDQMYQIIAQRQRVCIFRQRQP